MKSDIKPSIQEFVGVSQRIANSKLTTESHQITIIPIYSPTETSTNEELEDYYEKLDYTLERYRSPINLIIGDFNSKVGSCSNKDKARVGPHVFGIRNKRGERMEKSKPKMELVFARLQGEKRNILHSKRQSKHNKEHPSNLTNKI
ncbi:uncharacterized protein LOC126249371 [Schistocerca nitens]|uniref:uncharacterized protein LOC126249371 n=1 Tax=Schistocerca nitens TaxID=7011 RepID=UPI002119B63C|nr:uncharacterized protein LOC126249371 [Schistocerca nitens]